MIYIFLDVANTEVDEPSKFINCVLFQINHSAIKQIKEYRFSVMREGLIMPHPPPPPTPLPPPPAPLHTTPNMGENASRSFIDLIDVNGLT